MTQQSFRYPWPCPRYLIRLKTLHVRNLITQSPYRTLFAYSSLLTYRMMKMSQLTLHTRIWTPTISSVRKVYHWKRAPRRWKVKVINKILPQSNVDWPSSERRRSEKSRRKSAWSIIKRKVRLPRVHLLSKRSKNRARGALLIIRNKKWAIVSKLLDQIKTLTVFWKLSKTV